jgi:formate dehydrogenase subunit gamma
MSQPETASAPAAWDPEGARALIRELVHLPGPLLPVLHAVHDAFGYIPREAVPIVAEELNLARAEVHGVISFYHFFRQQPPGHHTVRICRAEACQSMNGDALAEHASRRLGTEFHGTSADGRYSLEPVYCLGNCSLAPSAMIDGKVYGRVDPERLDELLTGSKGE